MILTTPDQIEYFRLASMKQRVKLESIGLKSRGISIRKHMAQELGLKSSASYEVVIGEIDKKLSKMLEEMHSINSSAFNQSLSGE